MLGRFSWSRCGLSIAIALGATALASAAHLIVVRKRRRRQDDEAVAALWEVSCGLSAAEVERFGRQLVLAKMGVDGQRALLNGSALVVGAGGLGCPVALYLCAAGVGRIGIVDDDTVAVSNLHRQIGHSVKGVGQSKARSLRRACLAINDAVQIDVFVQRLRDVGVATELASGYDVIVDCTDAPRSRYMLNDAAVASGRPLVAASAVGVSGQLTVYNLLGGPCLRCAFPEPPRSEVAQEAVASCEEHGVLGPVPGIIGTLAALETIKVLVKGTFMDSILSGRMLLYDGLDASQLFRTMKFRKKVGCVGCDSEPTQRSADVEGRAAPSSNTGVASVVPELSAAVLRARLLGDVDDFHRSHGSNGFSVGDSLVVIDVRAAAHYAVSHVSGSSNWPLAALLRSTDEELRGRARALRASADEPGPEMICVCRRGNDSRRAAQRLRQAGLEASNLDGGLQALMAQDAKSLSRLLGEARPQLT